MSKKKKKRISNDYSCGYCFNSFYVGETAIIWVYDLYHKDCLNIMEENSGS